MPWWWGQRCGREGWRDVRGQLCAGTRCRVSRCRRAFRTALHCTAWREVPCGLGPLGDRGTGLGVPAGQPSCAAGRTRKERRSRRLRRWRAGAGPRACSGPRSWAGPARKRASWPVGAREGTCYALCEEQAELLVRASCGSWRKLACPKGRTTWARDLGRQLELRGWAAHMRETNPPPDVEPRDWMLLRSDGGPARCSEAHWSSEKLFRLLQSCTRLKNRRLQHARSLQRPPGRGPPLPAAAPARHESLGQGWRILQPMVRGVEALRARTSPLSLPWDVGGRAPQHPATAGAVGNPTSHKCSPPHGRERPTRGLRKPRAGPSSPLGFPARSARCSPSCASSRAAGALRPDPPS